MSAAPSGWAPRRATAVAVLLMAVAAVPLAWRLNVWLDEGYTLHTTAEGPAVAFRRALDFELAPPAYFVSLAAWRELAPGAGFARLYSVLWTAAALAALGVTARLVAGPVPAAWLVVPLAWHPFVLYAATEARVYAMMLALAAGILAAFLAGHAAPRPRPAARLACAALAWLALWTQYYGGFLLLGLGVGLVATGRIRAAVRYAADMALVGVACLPLFLNVPHHFASHATGERSHPGLRGAASFLWGRTVDFVLPLWPEAPAALFALRVGLLGLLGVALALAAAGRLRAARAPRAGLAAAARRGLAGASSHAPGVPLLAIALGAALVPYLAVFLSSGELGIVQRRHVVAVVPLLWLTATSLTWTLGGPRLGRGLGVAMALFGVLGSYGSFGSLTKRGDWRHVAEHLEAEAAPGEPILVFHPAATVPLGWHYHGPSPLVGVPEAPVLERWRLEDYVLEGPAQVEAALVAAGQPARPESLWVVTDGIDGYLGVDFHRSVLEAWVAARYEVVEDRAFEHTRVRHLRSGVAAAGSGA